MTNFLSFTPISYKLALVKTLIHRTYMICNTWQLFNKDISKLRETLQRNMYPIKIIDNELRKYLNKIYDKNKKKDLEKNKNTHYYKLPYHGKISKITKNKINTLCKELCKDINITLSFSVNKIGSFFSSKSTILSTLKSHVVYKFICPSCGASYIGETTRHLVVRIKEHLTSDKNSHIFQHINKNEACKTQSDESSFSVIDTAPTEYLLKIKEAIHIFTLKPSLNKQKSHLSLSINI